MLNPTCKLISAALCAGICISLGCIAFLMSPVKIVGAVLFAVGLLAVVVHGLKLFTGTVCSAKPAASDLHTQLVVLLGNILGVLVAALLFAGANLQTPVQEVVAAKLSASWLAIFCKAVFCNILICIAVDEWKGQKNSLIVIFGVAVFVFCGFEHCIANAFYMLAAGNFSLSFFAVNVLGNAAGGIGFWRMKHLAV